MAISISSAASGVFGPSTNAVTNPSVTASPYTYTNATSGAQNVVIVGGTVSVTGIIRGGSTANAGSIADAVVLNPGDGLVITYSVAPTLSVFQLS